MRREELEHIFIHVRPSARHEFVPVNTSDSEAKKKLIIFRWSSSCVIVDEIGMCLRGEIERGRNNNSLVPLNH